MNSPSEGGPSGDSPRWAARLSVLAAALRRDPRGSAGRTAALEEAWAILGAALTRSAGAQSAYGSRLDPEDLADLVSEKSLDLARRLESGAWNPAGRTPPEIAGFIRSVARNALVEVWRSKGRSVAVEDIDEATWSSERGGPAETVSDDPEEAIRRERFVHSLRDCARALTPRDRAAWFLRVFYELKSRDIAQHPEVAVKPAHVDVLLQRCRDLVRRCMSAKGWSTTEVPPGAFAALWVAFRLPAEPEGTNDGS